MSERVVILGEDVKDSDGNITEGAGNRVIDGCVVDMAGQSGIDGDDVVDGNSDTLKVLAPPGTVVREGERVMIRGVEYTIAYIPFDYSVGRRPVLGRRHRPRTVFIAERREA